MPGPVSDSYDPLWGTASNRDEVVESLKEVRERLTLLIGGPPNSRQGIIGVARGPDGDTKQCRFTVRELRLLRFALRVALDEDTL